MKAAKWHGDAALIAGVILLGSITGWIVVHRQSDASRAAKARSSSVSKPAEKAHRQTPMRPATPATRPQVSSPSSSANSSPRRGKPPALDPEARRALKRVGSDADAEQYWIAAINNPILPAQERQDLIEDLNEDGLSDPKNPGVIDLPLINSRIRLIEQLLPDAMDRVNTDAFKEAHKDLLKMQAKLGGFE